MGIFFRNVGDNPATENSTGIVQIVSMDNEVIDVYGDMANPNP